MTATDLARIIDDRARLEIRRVTHAGKPAPEYRGRLRLRCDTNVAEQLQTRYGGSISAEKQPNGTPRETVLYELTGDRLAVALYELQPALRRQRALAETLIQLRALQERPPMERTVSVRLGVRVVSPEYQAACEALWQRAEALNRELQGP